MSHCVVCGKQGDTHHVIHKAQGGLETPLNYIYLCAEHHRGFMGPHRNSDTDLYYKLDMQKNLEELFSSKHYSALEIRSISQISNSNLKKFMKTNRLHKEGYDRNDIIYFLMGGNIYRCEDQMRESQVEQYYEWTNA